MQPARRGVRALDLATAVQQAGTITDRGEYVAGNRPVEDEVFEPAEARRLIEKLEGHYTPKHGSWLHQIFVPLPLFTPLIEP